MYSAQNNPVPPESHRRGQPVPFEPLQQLPPIGKGFLLAVAKLIARGEAPVLPLLVWPPPLWPIGAGKRPAFDAAAYDALLDPDRPGLPRWRADALRLALGTHESILDADGRFHVWRASGHEGPEQPGYQRRGDRPLCGARTRKGTPCKACCVPGRSRCRCHGGAATGPKTAAGRAAIAESNRRRAQRA